MKKILVINHKNDKFNKIQLYITYTYIIQF